MLWKVHDCIIQRVPENQLPALLLCYAHVDMDVQYESTFSHNEQCPLRGIDFIRISSMYHKRVRYAADEGTLVGVVRIWIYGMGNSVISFRKEMLERF